MTCSHNHFRISDPFRLYTLDVFEYVLNDTMALYGAIPFIISNGNGNAMFIIFADVLKTTLDGSDGILWLNAAETFVDLFSTNPGRSVSFFSHMTALFKSARRHG